MRSAYINGNRYYCYYLRMVLDMGETLQQDRYPKPGTSMAIVGWPATGNSPGCASSHWIWYSVDWGHGGFHTDAT
jgi:hypothetical protein